MARKTSLRDFQEYLAGRLKTAAQGKGGVSWLGIQAGDETWLVDLADSGEIVQAPQLTGVPLARPWFAGIANIRGNLYAVTDFSLFRGGQATPQNASTRLLLVGVKHGSNAALLVSRMLGLKNPEDFTPTAAGQDAPAWAAVSYTDRQGKLWHKLAVRDLLVDQDFMNIGV
ncbi:MAG: CheW protein [Proteobacteria bacterium]|nr:CheW protein [Pseudomonadota bacterium]